MKFLERQVDGSFTYTVEDVFGTIVLKSTKKMSATELDTFTQIVLQAGIKSGTINEGLSFEFKKNNDWLKDEDKPKYVIVPPTSSPKSRAATFLLCFFLGGFGAHRFYVGRPVSAVIQLFLTCSMIGLVVSAPWVLVDLVFIAWGNFPDRNDLAVKEW
jgi:TM2 domain-containing membrane protein YozV